ncbi:energy-coupling factor ABC transporter substrate-binding protein [Paenibacillus turpanensis]|uniref:energy-coupling factor ABC transporter substrate-binding protein n=1 Tax=Paenibacillus turpanensis TaxID=2689078 RepID=UPI00140AC2FB|nr:energy-coupling factor ABC transporter substrate-binding protein [Paenibacillus turpanensis]
MIRTKNIVILLAVIALAVLPLLFVEGEFGGADGAAEEMIVTLAPQYEPWFQSFFEPPAETESALFALQAALGAGFIGYVIGLFKGRASKSAGTK